MPRPDIAGDESVEAAGGKEVATMKPDGETVKWMYLAEPLGLVPLTAKLHGLVASGTIE